MTLTVDSSMFHSVGAAPCKLFSSATFASPLPACNLLPNSKQPSQECGPMRKITMGWVHLGNVKYDVKAEYSHLGLDLYIFCHIPACAIVDSTKPPADFSISVLS
jgi:hypothetical protein